MNDRPNRAIAHAADMPEIPHLASAEAVAQRHLPRSLAELEALLKRDLDLVRYPAKSWVLPRMAPNGEQALDVLIVGGGQAGFAAAFGLMLQRVGNVLVVDENPEGQEGPWATYARMETLRTKKDVGGLELGFPNLSVRAWFEAQYGQAWPMLYKLPTTMWHQYLQWYRRMLSLPVRNATRLVRFGPDENGLLRAELVSDGIAATVWARTIVLASGIEGSGTRHVPAFVSDGVPKSRWAHSHEAIDFAALSGKVVAVLGGSASAFDNAVAAAEHGAITHVFHRAQQLRPANAMAWAEFSGYLAHYPDLPPLERWRFTQKMRRFKTGPPQRTLQRALELANLTLHTGCIWNNAAVDGERVRISATDGDFIADYLILGTGYVTDVALVEELAEHLPLMALWRDVFTPPPGEEDAGLAKSPYLGTNFETLEKVPGTAPWLNAVFNFSRGAGLSMGPMPAGLSGIKFGVPRLVSGITRRLFVEDASAYFEGMTVWQANDKMVEP